MTSEMEKDVMNFVQILKKILFPSHLIENTINSCVTKAVSSYNSRDPDLAKPSTYYFILLMLFFFL